MSKRSTNVVDPEGHYAEFLMRLDLARASLVSRREALDATIEVVERLYEHNATGLQLWAQRSTIVAGILAHRREDAKDHGTQVELQEVAAKMESMFRERTQRIEAKRLAIRGHFEEIDDSLLELEKSSVKLHSSRMLSQERENLNKAVAQLAGSRSGAPSAIQDMGLRDDLKDARQAVILAEALIEVKGH